MTDNDPPLAYWFGQVRRSDLVATLRPSAVHVCAAVVVSVVLIAELFVSMLCAGPGMLSVCGVACTQSRWTSCCAGEVLHVWLFWQVHLVPGCLWLYRQGRPLTNMHSWC